MNHTIITRYCVGQPDIEWHRQRLPLLKSRFIPSLEAQTCQNFRVLLTVDRKTPKVIRDELEECLPNGRYIVTEKYRDNLTLGIENNLTTRLDSDDEIADFFVEELQKAAVPGHVINFTDGYIEERGKLYPYSYAAGMFLSVYHHEKDCYADEHNRMPLHFPVISIGGRRAWIHVQHPNAITAQQGRNKKFDVDPEFIIPRAKAPGFPKIL